MPILAVVESPSKIKKIQGYLGDDYDVQASKGHIRNLPRDTLGFDIANNYTPEFADMPDKKDVISNLKKIAKKCSKVIGFADADREGSAISYHIFEICGVKPEQRYRAKFTEITKPAIQNAIQNLQLLDMKEVYSQFARMVLDKLIGYKVSPLLWKEFGNYHLSAGRVQSVVVRLIAEREAEIEKFDSQSYFKILANFVLDKKDLKGKGKAESTANYIETVCDNDIKDRAIVEAIYNNCADGSAKYIIKSVTKSMSKRNPSPPFTTSTLQQEASSRLGMSPDVCMKTAQKLYEAGMITYMRTDALFIAEDAHKAIKAEIEAKWSDKYYRRVNYKSKAANAQEAHECCRPVDIKRESVMDVDGLTASHNRLYQLIWRRTIASQMSPADVEIRTVKIIDDNRDSIDTSNDSIEKPKSKKKVKTKEIENENETDTKKENDKIVFIGKHEKIIFEGFMAANNLHKKKAARNIDGEVAEAAADGAEDEDAEDTAIANSEYLEKIFEKLKEGDQVWPLAMDCTQKFTKPPHARFTEASLIKKLDELGIGRPATFSNMVHKVQEEQRKYVELKTLPAKKAKITILKYNYPDSISMTEIETKIEGDKNKLFPTALGIMINEYLTKSFADIINYEFTAQIETQLDEIAEGTKVWHRVVDAVYVKLYPIIDGLAKATATRKALKSTDPSADTANRRFLGNHPTTKLPIYALKSRNGYLVCEENPEKTLSRFGNFTQKFDTMTLEKALALLVFPKNIGTYESHDIILKKARNIYIAYNGANYSIDNYLKANTDIVIDAVNLSQEEAINIIKYYAKSKTEAAANAKKDRVLSPDITVKVGYFGPYIKYQGSLNIPLPKADKERWEELTLEECQVIVDKKGGKASSKFSKKTEMKTAAKTAAKKTVATKAKPAAKKPAKIELKKKAPAKKKVKDEATEAGPAEVKPKKARKKKTDNDE